MSLKFVKIALFFGLIIWLRSFYVIPLWFFGLWLMIKIIEHTKNFEYIQGADLLFLWEYENTPNTIISSLIMDNISFEEFLKIFQDRVLNFKRMRQSVEIMLNEAFWKEHNINDCFSQIKRIDHLNNYKDIVSFKEKLFGKTLPFDRPIWEVYFQERYDSNKSLLIIKFHHSLGDGGALLNLLSSLSDDKQFFKEYRAQLPNVSFLQRCYLIIMSPVYMVLTAPKLDNKNENPLASYSGLPSGQFKIAESKEYEVSLLKTTLRGFTGITINDFAWTVLSRAIKQFIDKNRSSIGEKNEVKSIVGLMGVSFRTSINDGEMGNESAGSIMSINCDSETIENHLNHVKEITKKPKNKIAMKSASYAGGFIMNTFMDKTTMLKFGEKAFEKVGFVFSNIQGPKDKVFIQGREVIDFHPVLPHGNLSFSMITFSYKNKLRFCINTDLSYNLPTEELISLIEKEVDNFIKIYS